MSATDKETLGIIHQVNDDWVQHRRSTKSQRDGQRAVLYKAGMVYILFPSHSGRGSG